MLKLDFCFSKCEGWVGGTRNWKIRDLKQGDRWKTYNTAENCIVLKQKNNGDNKTYLSNESKFPDSKIHTLFIFVYLAPSTMSCLQ